VQTPCGAAEMQLFSNRDEVAKMSKTDADSALGDGHR
jgi:hypothetical protein